MIAKAIPVRKANAKVVQIEIRHAAVVRHILGILQHVPNTAYRVNQRCASFKIYLAAQAINVNVDNVR